MFEDIKDYLDVFLKFRWKENNFFCAANYPTSDPVKFYVNGNLGKSSFRRYIQDACQKAGAVGEGVVNHMVVHGLRGTVIARLFETGFAVPSVALRSEHRDFCSFKSYQNLRGELGRQQQAAIVRNFSGETTNVWAIRGTSNTLKDNAEEVAIREKKAKKLRTLRTIMDASMFFEIKSRLMETYLLTSTMKQRTRAKTTT